MVNTTPWPLNPLNPFYARLGGPRGRSAQVRGGAAPPGFDPRTVQSVASRYTDYAMPPPPPPGVILDSDLSQQTQRLILVKFDTWLSVPALLRLEWQATEAEHAGGGSSRQIRRGVMGYCLVAWVQPLGLERQIISGSDIFTSLLLYKIWNYLEHVRSTLWWQSALPPLSSTLLTFLHTFAQRTVQRSGRRRTLVRRAEGCRPQTCLEVPKLKLTHAMIWECLLFCPDAFVFPFPT